MDDVKHELRWGCPQTRQIQKGRPEMARDELRDTYGLRGAHERIAHLAARCAEQERHIATLALTT